MSNIQKRISKSLILGLIIVFLLMNTSISAPIQKNIDVTYNSVNITVNGDHVFTDNLLYEGTTYAPLREVSEILEKEVGWDSKTNTASINDSNLGIKKNNGNKSKGILSKAKKNITVTYNSVNITVNGEKVFSDNLLYDGTTYVPVREISEILGKEVEWDNKTNTVSINNKGFKPEEKVVSLGELKVHFLDVGQGDSIFIELPNSQNVLIDGGTRSKGKIVLDYLNKYNVNKIDYLIATHPHEDHIGGLIEVINNYDIGNIYMPAATHTTKTFEDLLLAIKTNNYKMNQAIAGGVIVNKDGVELKILAPEENIDDSNLNNHSVVIRLDHKDNSFLFTGDAEQESEQEMINKGYNLRADVLKAGHHGSNTSTTEAFLNKVNPKYTVISCGIDNKYGHPNNETLNKFKNRNIEVFRTDLDGTIVAKSDGNKIIFNKKPSNIKENGVINNNQAKPTPEPAVNKPTQNKTDDVYITKTGTKYHRSNCSSLSRSKIPISLEEAKRNYEPCKICKP